MKRWIRFIALGLLATASLCAQSNLEVSGMGFLKNRSLDARLSFLHGIEPNARAELDAALLEDSAFLLLEVVKRRGYLKPVLEGRFQIGGTLRTARWESRYGIQLDMDFVAEHAEFEVLPGVLSYYESVAVSGVDAIPPEKIERFFIPGGVLLQRKRARVFTHVNFERRTVRLLQALDDLGYRAVRVVGEHIDADDESGSVRVRLEIEQGALHRIGDVEILIGGRGAAPERRFESSVGVVSTRDWEQTQRDLLRNEAYRAGYPDAKISQEIVSEVATPVGELIRNYRFRVEWGPQVELAGIRFVGDEATRRSVLRSKTNLELGEPLDLIEVSEARRKLMGLGIYNEVGMSFEPACGGVREVIYELGPNERNELQLRGGWGSYELARLGFRWQQRNPWGRAHRYELEVKQSFKATQAKATYSIPQVFGTDLTAYLNTEYRSREEISFDRTAQGVAIGTSVLLGESGVRLALEYGFSRESANRDEDVAFESIEDATVASVTARASLDRRDDFLAPTSGYSLFASLKTASRFFGGSVDFQKIEVGGSFHFALTDSTLVHTGLRYGSIFTSGQAEDDIPFNERFFLGGENTVRGYREGAATLVDRNGDEIGAEVYLLGNFELEQRLFTKFSVLAFFDAVANARGGLFQEDGELLYSVGLGVRYNTVVGPVRLEYGHNPDARAGDPGGMLHFSIGFPF